MVKASGKIGGIKRQRTPFQPHWKRFAGERLPIKSGPKTRVTGVIRRFASRFPGNSFSAIERMANAIAFFKLDTVNAISKFGRQSAHESISSKSIPSFEILVNGTHHGFTGYTHRCDALIACLKAKGVKGVRFVGYKEIDRPHIHSMVLFKFKGKTFFVDYYSLRKKPSIAELDSPLLKNLRLLKKIGWLVEGKDSFDAGIKSIKDFWLGKKLDYFEVRERNEEQELAYKIRKGIEREIGI